MWLKISILFSARIVYSRLADNNFCEIFQIFVFCLPNQSRRFYASDLNIQIFSLSQNNFGNSWDIEIKIWPPSSRASDEIEKIKTLVLVGFDLNISHITQVTI